jgi:hypothetical protein
VFCCFAYFCVLGRGVAGGFCAVGYRGDLCVNCEPSAPVDGEVLSRLLIDGSFLK